MAETVSQLLDRLLDRGYECLALPVLDAMGATLDTPLLKRRLAELNAEARRLADLGEKLDINNPVLRAYTADLEAALERGRKVVADNADNLLQGAVGAAREAAPALAGLGALDPSAAARVLTGWNMVSVEALAAQVSFTSSPAWSEALADIGRVQLETINRLALRGFVSGWSPNRVALEISRTGALPRQTANVLMRTMYLQSYRQSTALTYERNRGIIETAIRYATLDNRTCPVCIALHGTEIPVGQPVEAHYLCRCTSMVKLVGVDLAPFPTGEEWFAGLPESTQRDRLGPQAYELWRDGRIQLRDLVKRRDDPLYGTMLERRSLAELGYR
ncbi:MAG: phage head morphogenesis protein [Anaerolineae bacterium]|jgi:hypothetical protein|nr:phage head morphogenesis protein [Anaerolineae bacterium]